MSDTSIVFIIDDDLDNHGFLMEAIKEIGSSIECYTDVNRQEGLTKLKANAVPFPFLIFLDLNMPRMDGRKVLVCDKKTHEI